jgi:LPXTG-motif cell wall-anchored protein
MRSPKTFSLAVIVGALALTSVYADPWDKRTIISINAPIQIPNATLQPGTYTLKLLESASNRHIVTVWDKDGMKLVTTVLAIPNYRLQPTGKSVFTFWETPANEPPALRAWFYPGDNTGQEFAYPHGKAHQLAMLNKQEVPVLHERYDSSATAETKEVESSPAPAPVAANDVTPDGATTAAVEPEPIEPAPAPVPEPAVVVEPEPEAVAAAEEPQTPATPAPTPPPADTATLPKTATNWNELLLVGLLTAALGLSTFFVRKRV